METLYSKHLSLYHEIDVITDLARKALSVNCDDALFVQQISLLLNRVEVMSAIKEKLVIDTFENLEDLARNSGCSGCDTGCGNCD